MARSTRSGTSSRLLKNPVKTDRIRRREEPADAGSGREAGQRVQLRLAGGAGSQEPPTAADSRDGGCGPCGAVAGVRGVVLECRAAVDSAREAAAGLAAADAVSHPQRADVDGAARLQPAVPLVCWSRDG